MSKRVKGNREAKKPKKQSNVAKDQNIDSKRHDGLVARIVKDSDKGHKE